MPPRRVWPLAIGCLLGALTCVGVFVACSQPPETSYGNPAGLRRDNIPGEGGVEELICTGVTGSGDGGGGGDGGAPCAVSFATDIFPLVKGDWKCTDAKCHGGNIPPTIAATTGAASYASMVAYTIKGSPYSYINPDGGGDPKKSNFLCNLMSQCGQGMPQAPGRAPTKDELCKIDAWLRCGAPNN